METFSLRVVHYTTTTENATRLFSSSRVVSVLMRQCQIGSTTTTALRPTPMAATSFPRVIRPIDPSRTRTTKASHASPASRDEASLSPPADVGHEPAHWPVSSRSRRLAQAYVRLVPVGLDLLRQLAVHVGRDVDLLPAVDVDSGDDDRIHWGCAHCQTSGLSLPECIWPQRTLTSINLFPPPS